MKTITLISILISVACSCQKQALTEPCNSKEKVACWHQIINNWHRCPNIITGELEVISVSGPCSIDSIFVCDTAQWLIDTRKWDEGWKEDDDPINKKLKQEYPNSCGCQ